jgi:metallo-beta-lactamase class B VIM
MSPASPREWSVTPDLQVRELRPGVWIHTSWQKLADGTRFPSNGLIVREGDHLLLIDTAWGEEHTERLLTWIDATLRLPVDRAVVTHWHEDRLGGAAALMRRGIPFFGHPRTREVAAEKGLPLPAALDGLASPGSAVRVGSAEVFYPGPAHTPDNLMVWLPEAGVLFGGCAVRAAASGIGNLSDADVKAWPDSMRRAIERYGSAPIVVPGHGDPGRAELLRHTLELATAPAFRDR